MKLNEMKKELSTLQSSLHAYEHAMAVLRTDSETGAPSASAAARGETMAFLNQKSYELLVSDRTRELLDGLWAQKEELDGDVLRQVELLRKNLDDMTRIPVEEVAEHSRLRNASLGAWLQAKAKNDYASFEPYLAKMIDAECRLAAYKDPSRPAYDVMLDSYEKGMCTAILDPFFSMLRSEIVPLIEKVRTLPPPPAIASCPIDRQRDFSARLMDIIGVDRTRCALAETEHPFTISMNRWDVRITTHYYEDALLSSVYSVMHEGGHAQYELGVSEAYQGTVLGSISSTGLHESQSRFYENLIGHNAGFLAFLLPKLKEYFPEAMADVTERSLFCAANHVEPSLIRIEADQVTYPLHIMVRYELEKQLVAGTLTTKDLPEAWNRLYKEYLGLDVPTDAMGVLQDMHWGGGMIGYFPTYALGSAYASQILHAMKKDLDVAALLRSGDIAPITAWLNARLHRWGDRYDPAQLLEMTTGEKFNPSYYVAHLKKVVADLIG